MNDEFDRCSRSWSSTLALPGMILGSVLLAASCPQAEVDLCLGLSVASTFVMFAVAYGFTLLLRIADGHRGVPGSCSASAMRVHRVSGAPAIFGPDSARVRRRVQPALQLLRVHRGRWFLTQDIDGDVKVQASFSTLSSHRSCCHAWRRWFSRLPAFTMRRFWGALNTLGSIPRRRKLIIGSSLANLPVRDLIGGPRLWTCSVFRLIVMPAIIWAVFHAFVPAGLMFSVAVVLAGMPMATNGTMLCYQYGGNSRVMAQGPSSPPCWQ